VCLLHRSPRLSLRLLLRPLDLLLRVLLGLPALLPEASLLLPEARACWHEQSQWNLSARA
jgi:hypothetical protein